jgi:hypothetical protein
MYVCMSVCMYVCMYACMYLSIYLCMHVCMYACMCVCKYVCMYVSQIKSILPLKLRSKNTSSQITHKSHNSLLVLPLLVVHMATCFTIFFPADAVYFSGDRWIHRDRTTKLDAPHRVRKYMGSVKEESIIEIYMLYIYTMIRRL